MRTILYMIVLLLAAYSLASCSNDDHYSWIGPLKVVDFGVVGICTESSDGTRTQFLLPFAQVYYDERLGSSRQITEIALASQHLNKQITDDIVSIRDYTCELIVPTNHIETTVLTNSRSVVSTLLSSNSTTTFLVTDDNDTYTAAYHSVVYTSLYVWVLVRDNATIDTNGIFQRRYCYAIRLSREPSNYHKDCFDWVEYCLLKGYTPYYSDKRHVPPPFDQQYRRAEQIARDTRSGIWGDGVLWRYISPQDMKEQERKSIYDSADQYPVHPQHRAP